MGPRLPCLQVSRSHTIRHTHTHTHTHTVRHTHTIRHTHTLGLLWTSDQQFSDAGTYATHTHTHTHTHSLGLLWTSDQQFSRLVPTQHTHSLGLLWTSDQQFSRLVPTQHTHTQNRRTSMTSAGFKPASPTIKTKQNYVLEPSATGIGQDKLYLRNFKAKSYLILWCCSVYSLNSLLLNWHFSNKICTTSSFVCHGSFARW
jgi:hypothetical protein